MSARSCNAPCYSLSFPFRQERHEYQGKPNILHDWAGTLPPTRSFNNSSLTWFLIIDRFRGRKTTASGTTNTHAFPERHSKPHRSYQNTLWPISELGSALRKILLRSWRFSKGGPTTPTILYSILRICCGVKRRQPLMRAFAKSSWNGSSLRTVDRRSLSAFLKEDIDYTQRRLDHHCVL